MIPVIEQPEPVTFDINVRQPGLKFLRTTPRPTNNDFKRARFWKTCLPDLRNSYRALCAYSAMPVNSNGSVDHFAPKTKFPRQAFEWRNYRLCLDRINGYKGEHEVLLDPFAIQPNTFYLDFANLFVTPNKEQMDIMVQRAQRTIDLLRLNIDDTLVELRFRALDCYLKSGDKDFLQQWYPFIAYEVNRQNYQ